MCIRKYYLSRFHSAGESVYIGTGCIFTPATIDCGSDVYIGPNCVVRSTYGKIVIGSHVMFGPGVQIHGGDHGFHEIGKLIKHESPKTMGDDGCIVIQDDVWIGANAIILSNVTVGKGSIIGAGSVVTKDISPYTIYTGVPERKIRRRFSDEEIFTHESILKRESFK